MVFIRVALSPPVSWSTKPSSNMTRFTPYHFLFASIDSFGKNIFFQKRLWRTPTSKETNMIPSRDVVYGILRHWLPQPAINWYVPAYRSIYSRWKPVRFDRMLRVNVELGQLDFAIVEDGWYGRFGQHWTITKYVYLCGMIHFTFEVDRKTKVDYFYQ